MPFQEITEDDLAPAGFKEIGEHDLATPTATAAPAPTPPTDQSLASRFLDKIKKGASVAGTLASDYANAASGGLYRQIRNGEGIFAPPDLGFVKPPKDDAGAGELKKREAEFHSTPAGEFAGNTASALGYLNPYSVASSAADAAVAAVPAVASKVAPAVARVLTSRPVANAVVGGVTGGATAGQEALTQGASLPEAAKQAGKGALVGAGIGAATGTVGAAAEKIGEVRAHKATAREITDIGNKATKTQRDALDAVAPEATKVIDQYGLGDVAHKPAELAAKVAPIKADVQAQLDKLRSAIPAADAQTTVDRLDKLANRYEKSNPKVAAQVRAQADAARRYLPATEKDLLASITEDAKASQKEKVGLKPKETVEVAKEFGLDQVANDPHQFQAKAKAAKDTTGKQIGDVYDQFKPPVDIKGYVTDLEEEAAKLAKNPANKAEAQAVLSHVADVRQAWGNPEYRAIVENNPGVPLDKIPVPEFNDVSAKEFNQYKSGLQSKAFTGGMLDPNASTKLRRTLAGTAKQHLETYLDTQAAAAPELSQSREDLTALNRKYEHLSNLNSIADRKVVKANLTPEAAPAADIPKNGKIPVATLTDMAESNQPFDSIQRNFKQPKTAAAKAKAKVAEAIQEEIKAAAKKVNQTAELERLQKQLNALTVIDEAASYKARAERYPATGLRDIAAKHGVSGQEIAAHAAAATLGHAAPAIHTAIGVAKTARPLLGSPLRGLDRRIAEFSRTAKTGEVNWSGLQDIAIKAGIPLTVASTIARQFGIDTE